MNLIDIHSFKLCFFCLFPITELPAKEDNLYEFLLPESPNEEARRNAAVRMPQFWYQSRRFCGHCGAPLRKHEKERMMYCDACHQMEYPKISPAVIIGITDGNRLRFFCNPEKDDEHSEIHLDQEELAMAEWLSGKISRLRMKEGSV